MPPFPLPQIPSWMKGIFLFTILGTITSPWLGNVLALSKTGLDHLCLWELVTYLLVYAFPSDILHLALNLGLIWIFGTNLALQMSPKALLSLYFGAGFFAALCAWSVMILLPTSTLSGCTTSVYAFLTTWAILNPRSHILLFFTAPIKTRHLVFFLIGGNLLIDLTRSQWVPLSAYIGACLFGYFFALLFGRTRSLIPFLEPFENKVLKFADWIRGLRKTKSSQTKIYDINSGEPVLNDEQFMDTMLAKISLHGESKLSREEKERMQKISQKLKSH